MVDGVGEADVPNTSKRTKRTGDFPLLAVVAILLDRPMIVAVDLVNILLHRTMDRGKKHA